MNTWLPRRYLTIGKSNELETKCFICFKFVSIVYKVQEPLRVKRNNFLYDAMRHWIRWPSGETDSELSYNSHAYSHISVFSSVPLSK